MIFDATGGRFKIPREIQAEQTDTSVTTDTLRIENPNKIPDEFSINLPEAPSFGKGHATHGITNVTDFKPHTVQVKKANGRHDVYHDGKMIKVALFKVTNVPIEHYEALINFTAPINQDSCFYTWPGNLRDGLNKLLLLINLEQSGYEALCQFLPESMSLRDFGEKGGFDLEAVDKRILDYIKIVYEAGTDIDQVVVEPPFLFTPSLNYLGEPFERLYDRPLVPVGDSIYFGHPKVGNGLGGHLSFLRYVLDGLLYLYGTP